MRHINTIVPVILLCITVSSLSAQQEISPDTMMKRLHTQTSLFPQENIYVQTDKSDYVAGDTLWFRAYLVNAISRKPEDISRYVYAELIDEQANTTTCRVKVRKDDEEMIHGYLPIPASLPKDTYRFRAYTRYGDNWGEDSFYSKPVRIYATRKREAPQTKSNKADYQVDFLPEGGYAIDGQLCRFAFKAQNSSGKGEEVHGFIIDEKGDILTSFAPLHNGMGVFSFMPSADKKYNAVCINTDGKRKRFVLPQAVRQAGTLQVTTDAKKCYVTLVHDSLFATDSLLIAVLQRGHPCFVKRWEKTENLIFAKQSFDTGIVHFLLVAANGKILSERSLFIDHSDYDSFRFSANCIKFAPRQQVNVSLEARESLNLPWNGSCSVAVTDAADVPIDRTTHILSTLLLTADLKGQIEAPGWYFETQDAKKRNQALDLLMMTHGWRRYDLQAAIQGKFTLPAQLPETSMILSGEVRTKLGKPINKSSVQIYAPKISLMKTLETDHKGQFKLDGFEWPDSVKYMITALSSKRKKNVVLRMDKKRFPDISSSHHTLSPGNWFNPDSSLVNEEKYIQKTIRNLGYNNGMRHYLLGEVKIDAKVKKVYQTDYEHDANITIKEDRIKQSPGLLNLDMILKVIAGAYSDVTYILDNIPIYDSNQAEWLLQSFNVGDIGQIDIIKGIKAAGYLDGKRPYIVAVTTKRGGAEYNTKYVDTNMTLWTPLGYQQPAEMYAPRYDQASVHSDKPDLRTTIYWKPNLTIKEGKASFSFYTADTPSTYHVVIEGVSTDGKIFRTAGTLFQTR